MSIGKPIAEPDLERLLRTLSRERLTKYLVAANEDMSAAIRLYEINTVFSEAFYTPLQGLEVAVRNAIHQELASHRGVNWYEEPGLLKHPLTEMVRGAQQKIAESGRPATPGRVVAELSFGFWTGILGSKHYEQLWRTDIRHAFPHRPKGTERKQVHSALNKVRRLRNRIAHHEAIIQRDLVEDNRVITDLTSWICPVTSEWVLERSRVSACETLLGLVEPYALRIREVEEADGVRQRRVAAAIMEE